MKLRNRIAPLMLLAFFGLFLTQTGCKSEGCTDPTSDNYDPDAKSDDGTCVPANEKFIGTWQVVSVCPGNNSNFESAIVAGANSTSITIQNFAQTGSSVTATVSQSSLTIPNQNITIGSLSFPLTGSGSINGNILTLSYTYGSGADVVTCTETRSR